jgi:hypothetical protein
MPPTPRHVLPHLSPIHTKLHISATYYYTFKKKQKQKPNPQKGEPKIPLRNNSKEINVELETTMFLTR